MNSERTSFENSDYKEDGLTVKIVLGGRMEYLEQTSNVLWLHVELQFVEVLSGATIIRQVLFEIEENIYFELILYLVW